jgi:multiple RNA-binding domain-containing protein 1
LKKSDGKGKGFAYVQFKDHAQAVEAYVMGDGKIFQGRLLHIIPGRAKKDTTLIEYEISKLPLKKQKEVRRKQEVTKATFNWNSLYLNVCSPPSILKSSKIDSSLDRCSHVNHRESHGHQQI